MTLCFPHLTGTRVASTSTHPSATWASATARCSIPSTPRLTPRWHDTAAVSRFRLS